jgi:hypothetical protein
MNNLDKWRLPALVAAFAALSFTTALADEPAPGDALAKPAPPRIQLAILLDTSGSMQGLINQARTQLWKIVNELATSRRDGQSPELEVALYEYGKSSLTEDSGYLRQIVPLTDDLDKLSEELFSLETNGGSEHCGQVIDAAVQGLAWSKSADDLKLIFIAGNEPFTQGPVDYQSACRSAVEKGITVNTIFCGPEPEGAATGWKDGARLADGSFLSINQNQQVAAVRTPYDDKLAELGTRFNRTVVTFGREADRTEALQRLEKADGLARGAAPAAAADRATFKGTRQYQVRSDLVEAVRERRVELEDLSENELPEELRGKSVEERKSILAAKETERKQVQSEIQKLSAERKKFIAEHEREQAQSGQPDTFDTAVLEAIRDQAAKKRFVFEK